MDKRSWTASYFLYCNLMQSITTKPHPDLGKEFTVLSSILPVKPINFLHFPKSDRRKETRLRLAAVCLLCLALAWEPGSGSHWMFLFLSVPVLVLFFGFAFFLRLGWRLGLQRPPKTSRPCCPSCLLSSSPPMGSTYNLPIDYRSPPVALHKIFLVKVVKVIKRKPQEIISDS